MLSLKKSAEQDTGEKILQAAFFLEKGLTETIQDYTHITLSQYKLLAELSIIEESSQKELSKLLAISRPAVNKLVTLLAKKGFILIQSSQSDKRETKITVTKEGMHQLTDASIIAKNYYKNYFSRLTPEEVEHLGQIITKL